MGIGWDMEPTMWYLFVSCCVQKLDMYTSKIYFGNDDEPSNLCAPCSDKLKLMDRYDIMIHFNHIYYLGRFQHFVAEQLWVPGSCLGQSISARHHSISETKTRKLSEAVVGNMIFRSVVCKEGVRMRMTYPQRQDVAVIHRRVKLECGEIGPCAWSDRGEVLLLGLAPPTEYRSDCFLRIVHISTVIKDREAFPPLSCPCGVGSYWIIAATEEVEMLQTQACASWWRAWTVWEHSWPWCGSVELVWWFQYVSIPSWLSPETRDTKIYSKLGRANEIPNHGSISGDEHLCSGFPIAISSWASYR